MEIPRFCHRPVFGENPPIKKSIISKRDHSVPFWSVQRTSEIESRSEKDEKKRYSLFWVNAHCRRLSARAPPGTAAARGYMAAGDGGPRWMVTEKLLAHRLGTTVEYSVPVPNYAVLRGVLIVISVLD